VLVPFYRFGFSENLHQAGKKPKKLGNFHFGDKKMITVFFKKNAVKVIYASKKNIMD